MTGADTEKENRKRKWEHWEFLTFLLVCYDFLAIHAAYFVALWGRFDFAFSQIPSDYYTAYRNFITIYAILSILVFWCFRLYRSMWRFASYVELVRTFEASVLMSIIHAIAITLLFRRMPLTYYLWGGMMQFILVIGIRFSYRIFLLMRAKRGAGAENGDNVMLIGAGSAGRMILRDSLSTEFTRDRIVCIIDDNSNKWNRYIDGVPIVGGRNDILLNVEKFDIKKIYLAIPSATPEEKRDLLSICNESGCELKQLPGMYQFITDQVTVSSLQQVSVEDLLGRAPIKADMKEVYSYISGKAVLVTGGGGSIGSELCRQVAEHNPLQLIVLDIYENNAYDIQLELKKKYPNLNLVVLIGSVRDSRRMYDIFDTYHPQIVYHAAAHKHVPLMEDSPNEAIKNNVIGTYKTAYAAMVHGCERFVLISTDKAVNPTNIMGASKRLCEMIIQAFDAKIKAGKADEIPQLYTHEGYENADKDGTGRAFQDIHIEFTAVRFGNVLGSNGSVIPVFKRQIEEGGPVTVTHPDIIRYFMTIREAVSLVMLAGTYAHGGEIFVLDMGSPVKIDTLARNLIRLSGYKPDEDIRIVYTGLRPGEKLYEEKLMAEEGLRKTENDLIHIGCPISFETDVFLKQLDELMLNAYRNKKDICSRVGEMVSTYQVERAV